MEKKSFKQVGLNTGIGKNDILVENLVPQLIKLSINKSL